MSEQQQEYPDVITPEVLAKNAHISTREIEVDMAETEMEIMTRLRLNWDLEGVEERHKFVRFLRRLLKARRDAEV